MVTRGVVGDADSGVLRSVRSPREGEAEVEHVAGGRDDAVEIGGFGIGAAVVDGFGIGAHRCVRHRGSEHLVEDRGVARSVTRRGDMVDGNRGNVH